jgi:hypothetical protein
MRMNSLYNIIIGIKKKSKVVLNTNSVATTQLKKWISKEANPNKFLKSSKALNCPTTPSSSRSLLPYSSPLSYPTIAP